MTESGPSNTSTESLEYDIISVISKNKICSSDSIALIQNKLNGTSNGPSNSANNICDTYINDTVHDTYNILTEYEIDKLMLEPKNNYQMLPINNQKTTIQHFLFPFLNKYTDTEKQTKFNVDIKTIYDNISKLNENAKNLYAKLAEIQNTSNAKNSPKSFLSSFSSKKTPTPQEIEQSKQTENVCRCILVFLQNLRDISRNFIDCLMKSECKNNESYKWITLDLTTLPARGVIGGKKSKRKGRKTRKNRRNRKTMKKH